MVFCHRVTVESRPLLESHFTSLLATFFVIRSVASDLLICPTSFWSAIRGTSSRAVFDKVGSTFASTCWILAFLSLLSSSIK